MYRSLFLLLGERAVQLAATFLGMVLLARSLSVESFGVYQYAVGLTSLMSVVVGLGLVPIVKRQLASPEARTADVVSVASTLRLILFIFAYAVLALIAFGDEKGAGFVLLIVGLAMLKESILVCDIWFQVTERFQYMTIASIVSAVFGLLLKVYGVATHQALLYFAFAYAFESLLLGSLLLVFYIKRKKRWPFGGVSLESARALMSESWPVWLSAISVVLYMRIDLIMLKSMVSEEALAHFACASRMAEISFILPNLMATLVFPRMVLHEGGASRISRFTRGYFTASLYIACLAMLSYALLGAFAIPLVFGESYSESVAPFLVLLLSLPFVALGVARGQYLTFKGKLRPMLPISIAGAVLNIVLNLAFIPKFGVMGAAYSSVASQAFTSLLSGALFPDLRKVFAVQLSSVFGLSALGYFYSCLSRPNETSQRD